MGELQTFTPYKYQRYCIDRIIHEPALALFLDMGLGKTVISLTAINELIYNRFEVNRVLVIAPKVVAESTWMHEAEKWAHLRLLRVVGIFGNRAQRLDALASPGDVYVIGRDNVEWLVRVYAERREPWPFDLVIADELTSFKDPKTKRFKALRAARPYIRRFVGLTGTPAANGLLGMWAQMYLVDGGERLGKSFSAYKRRYFDEDPYRHLISIKPGADEAITRDIADVSISMRAEDYLELPDLIERDTVMRLSKPAQEAYNRLARSYYLEHEGEEVTASSAVALTGKLLQLSGGTVYAEESQEALQIHSDKLNALGELLEALDGEPVLLFYQYRHEHDRILKLLTDKKKRFADVQEKTAVIAWNLGKLEVLLAHPASAAFGLNLQSGGHHIIWYTPTWSLEQYQQANARLHRQGQGRPVIVHRLLTAGGMDETVARALASKDKAQEMILDALRANIKQARENS